MENIIHKIISVSNPPLLPNPRPLLSTSLSLSKPLALPTVAVPSATENTKTASAPRAAAPARDACVPVVALRFAASLIDALQHSLRLSHCIYLYLSSLSSTLLQVFEHQSRVTAIARAKEMGSRAPSSHQQVQPLADFQAPTDADIQHGSFLPSATLVFFDKVNGDTTIEQLLDPSFSLSLAHYCRPLSINSTARAIATARSLPRRQSHLKSAKQPPPPIHRSLPTTPSVAF